MQSKPEKKNYSKDPGPENRFTGFVWMPMLLLVYVSSYFVVMVRGLPVKENGIVKFRSTFRWAPSAHRSGEFYMSEGKATVFNYLYLPLDFIFAKPSTQTTTGK